MDIGATRNGKAKGSRDGTCWGGATKGISVEHVHVVECIMYESTVWRDVRDEPEGTERRLRQRPGNLVRSGRGDSRGLEKSLCAHRSAQSHFRAAGSGQVQEGG